jgi:hypothetical protein
MNKQITGTFLATVAASAAPFGVSDAIADDMSQAGIDTRIHFAFEGGALSTKYQQDKLGATDKLGDTDADLYGSISVGRMYDTDLDWRLSGAVHLGSDNSYDLTLPIPGSGTVSFGENAGFNFQTLDFDLGKHVQVNNTNIRFFAGVRGLHVRETAGGSFTLMPADPTMDKAGTLDKLGTTDYWGVGPPIGAEVYHEVGRNWGFVGSLSGSAMYGRRDMDQTFSVDLFDPTPLPGTTTDVTLSANQRSSEVVTNVEAKAGIKWEFAPGKSITGGYRLDSWNNLLTMGDDESQLFQGVFVNVGLKY